MVVPILLIPYLIKTLGIAGFGIIALCQAVVSYGVIFVDYGFNFTATKNIAQSDGSSVQLSSAVSRVLACKAVLLILFFVFSYAILVTNDLRNKEKELKLKEEEQSRKDIDLKVREEEQKNLELKEKRRRERALKIIKEEEEKQKQFENLKIKEWEEKFDKEQKAKEHRENMREQRLREKELEKLRSFEEKQKIVENNLSSGLGKFEIDKSKEN